MSTYCIGDVHGCLRTLQALLRSVNYKEGRDRLWFTGDLIDRGPDSIGVLRLLAELPDVVAVMGNHDFHLLACYFNSPVSCKPSYRNILDTPGIDDYIPWLLSRPFIYHDNNFPWVLVHAGIYPTWSVQQAMQYGKELEGILQNTDSAHLSKFFMDAYGDKSTMQDGSALESGYYAFLVNVFTRMRYCMLDGALEFENTDHPKRTAAMNPNLTAWFDFSNRHFSDTLGVLFGHWAALGDSVRRDKLICLDSGCSWGEKLTAYCLESGKFYQVPYQDR